MALTARVPTPEEAALYQAPRRRPTVKRTPARRELYWTRERVLEALRKFYRVHGVAPTSSHSWGELTLGGGKHAGPNRPYPCAATICGHFPTLREAWIAAGVVVDRAWEEWTPDEDWYLREAAGLLSRREIARDLRRSPDAVHRRLYDMGVHSYQAHGWSTNRIVETTGVKKERLTRYMLWKKIEWAVGTKCWYFQPADLVVVEEIDWTAPRCADLAAAARQQLYQQLAGLLKGRAAQMAGGSQGVRWDC